MQSILDEFAVFRTKVSYQNLSQLLENIEILPDCKISDIYQIGVDLARFYYHLNKDKNTLFEVTMKDIKAAKLKLALLLKNLDTLESAYILGYQKAQDEEICKKYHAKES